MDGAQRAHDRIAETARARPAGAARAPLGLSAMSGRGARRRPSANDPDLGPVDVLGLQSLAGNRAVAQLHQPRVQRDGPDGGVPAAGAPTAGAPTSSAGPSDAGTAPAGGVPEDAHAQLRRAFAEHTTAAVGAVSDFGVATDAERLTLITIMLESAPFEPGAAGTVRRIWQAFGDQLPHVASDRSALWERCNVAGAQLPGAWLGAGAGHVAVGGDEEVGGWQYVVAGAFDYQITGDAINVTVKINFVPDAGVTVPVSQWFGYVTATWNHYTAVNQTDRTQKRRVEFKPVQAAGMHDVTVHAGGGRANAGEYYVGDTRAANTIPHEFGHLVGLEDEYERSAADYKRVTGEEPPAAATDTLTAAITAGEIRAAIMQPEHLFEFHTTAVERRMGALNRVLYANHFPTYYSTPETRAVAAAYKTVYGNELSADIVAQVDQDDEVSNFRDWREGVVGIFEYTNTSIMGNPDLAVAGTPEHDHPVQPRHVRHFAQLVEAFLGHGAWTPEADH